MNGTRVPDTELSIGDSVFVAWLGAVRQGVVKSYEVSAAGTMLCVQTDNGGLAQLDPSRAHKTARDACAEAFNVLDDVRAEPLQLDMLRGRLRELVSQADWALGLIVAGLDEDADELHNAILNARAVL